MNCPECGKEMTASQPVMVSFEPGKNCLKPGYTCECEPGAIYIAIEEEYLETKKPKLLVYWPF